MPEAEPDFAYLFRFRDLVADTIEEHRKIIQQHHQVWWGWWKRPAEGQRDDVWTEIVRATAANAAVRVGLFNSGTGEVYVGEVIGVIPPAAGANTPSSSVAVPEAERDLIPSYYRESPFSRAWLKLRSLEGPVPFFGDFSYAEPPRLPNYSEAILSRLSDKVIETPEELRGMDTTIWHVRRRRGGDSVGEVILGTTALAEAISKQAVQADSDLILHITDPHFAVDGQRAQHRWRLESEAGPSPATMADAIGQALAGRAVGFIVVTGDLTFTGTAAEYEEARKSLAKLLGILDLAPDHLVVIPGNHDIQWSTDAVYSDDSEVRVMPKEARANYQSFYAAFFGHQADSRLAMGRRILLPCGLALEICALNSSSLGTGKHFLAGMGRIDEQSFGDVAAALGWQNGRTMALRILAIHHHLALTEDLEPAAGHLHGHGLAVDAVRIQRMARRFGVQLALHGHKHRAFLWRSSVYELPEYAQRDYKLGEISIVGGGSVGSTEVENNSNFFNLIKLSPRRLELDIFRSRNGGVFESMQRWSAPFELDEASEALSLRDWERLDADQDD